MATWLYLVQRDLISLKGITILTGSSQDPDRSLAVWRGRRERQMPTRYRDMIPERPKTFPSTSSWQVVECTQPEPEANDVHLPVPAQVGFTPTWLRRMRRDLIFLRQLLVVLKTWTNH